MRLMGKFQNVAHVEFKNAAHEEIPICGARGSSNMRLTMKFQYTAHEEVPICGS